MKPRIWIKLRIELLDDTEFGLLPEFYKWHAIELFLVAGENGNDGLLPPVERLAWRLRLPQEKLEETLAALTQAGVVHETPQGWVVTDFAKQQASVSDVERNRQYRERLKAVTKRNENAHKAGVVDSTSTSESDSASDSDSGEGVQGEGLPQTPAQALAHPDLRVYSTVTGGRIPGASQYRQVIEAVRYLRNERSLDDQALAGYLAPFWAAWTGRTRQDGRPYGPANITWLTEWALNGVIPPPVPPVAEEKGGDDPMDVIKRVARRQK